MRSLPSLLTLCLATCLFATTTAATEREECAERQRGDQGREQHRLDRWWRDQNIKKQLGLTKEQEDKIDAIFASWRPEMDSLLNELRKRQGELDRLLQKTDADESAVFSAIDRVEHVRYEINRNHLYMLYRIRRCLTPEQHAALTKIAADRRVPRQR